MSTPDLVRPAWSAEQLTDEVRQRSGTQFDPEVADLVVAMIAAGDADLLAADIGVHRTPTEE
jgi:HD-GYP domain-containing protein (c-di-GMP phosphodiesterase class II)